MFSSHSLGTELGNSGSRISCKAVRGGGEGQHSYLLPFNPLRLNINIHILLSVFHTFLIILVEGICTNIKAFHVW